MDEAGGVGCACAAVKVKARLNMSKFLVFMGRESETETASPPLFAIVLACRRWKLSGRCVPPFDTFAIIALGQNQYQLHLELEHTSA